MLDNYIELLTILELNRLGLTTTKINEIAIERGKKLLRDVTNISQMIHQCKKRGWVVSQQVDDRIVSKITLNGIDALNEQVQKNSTNEGITPMNENVSFIDKTGEFLVIDENKSISDKLREIAARIDEQSKKQVDNIELKIQTLTRLGEVMSDDIKKVLESIIEDLKS